MLSFNRENIHLKPNTRFQERLRPTERVASRIEAHRRRKVNSTRHVILPTIRLTQTAPLCSSQRQTSKWRLFLITLKSKQIAPIQQEVPMGNENISCGLGKISICLLSRSLERPFAPKTGLRCTWYIEMEPIAFLAVTAAIQLPVPLKALAVLLEFVLFYTPTRKTSRAVSRLDTFLK